MPINREAAERFANALRVTLAELGANDERLDAVTEAACALGEPPAKKADE